MDHCSVISNEIKVERQNGEKFSSLTPSSLVFDSSANGEVPVYAHGSSNEFANPLVLSNPSVVVQNRVTIPEVIFCLFQNRF